MKILVDKMPESAEQCIFHELKQTEFWQDDRCRVDGSYCDYATENGICPYLKEIKDG